MMLLLLALLAALLHPRLLALKLMSYAAEAVSFACAAGAASSLALVDVI
jgi:hypothetical protein